VTNEVRALVDYRLSQSEEALRSAAVLSANGLWRDSVNRSYYAQFYCVLALLALRGLGSSKHTGVISLFDREFVKPGLLPKELSAALHGSFDLRQEADYKELAALTQERAEQAHREAMMFVRKVRDFITNSETGQPTE